MSLDHQNKTLGKPSGAHVSSIRIVLLVRRSKEFWLNGRVDPSFALKQPKRIAAAQRAISWWDQTFAMSYLQFRLGVREIAASRYIGAGLDDIIPWQDLAAVKRQPPGTWLLPIDEDDWLHENIGSSIRTVVASNVERLVTWDIIRKYADGSAVLNPNNFVESCGYAVRLPHNWMHICDHMKLAQRREHTIPRVLCIRNITPASLAFISGNPIGRILPAIAKGASASGANIPSTFNQALLRYQELLKELMASRFSSGS